MTTTTQQITQIAIQRAIDNNQPFSKIYYAFAEKWISTRFCTFTSDTLRKAFLEAGGQPPRHHNAWGGAIRKLAKKRLIFDTGHKLQSDRPEAHCRELRIWISAKYKLQQKANATRDKTLEIDFTQSA